MTEAFEGAEKLLEVWFAPDEHDVPTEIKGGRSNWTGLRQVGKEVWDGMLDEVQCKVLSVIEGKDVDAYLLSESSMFVWPHKLILKTCGTTTLLLGLPTLLRIASETCSFKGVWRCFYSRKTFMFPDRQRGPHKDWTQEINFLDQLFENSSAYTVGRMNGDHWLLYLTPPRPDVHPRILSPPSDQTLEILMSQLHPSAHLSPIHWESRPSSLKGTAIDSYLFSPCGFSSNAINGDEYATIHVTPEVECSYASFETNLLDSPNIEQLVESVLKVFRPEKLSMTLFISVDEEEQEQDARDKAKGLLSLGAGYERVDRIMYEFQGYLLVYAVWSAVPGDMRLAAIPHCYTYRL
ncbi:S-adenosylmethionine decarboxylase [Gymnopus androsaceus JB14]|uniref:S-adenosylmethionine decarboxylase proenzyme n=1 Tax=Gymnopus androsaceus JB14 TaxID=1447944 RepID=A0A6A4HXC8_9AGAR|nr:S-adenosylmethionine decarboxylase [Gymnopus androsaceus JB14]